MHGFSECSQTWILRTSVQAIGAFGNEKALIIVPPEAQPSSCQETHNKIFTLIIYQDLGINLKTRSLIIKHLQWVNFVVCQLKAHCFHFKFAKFLSLALLTFESISPPYIVMHLFISGKTLASHRRVSKHITLSLGTMYLAWQRNNVNYK